MTGAGEEYVTIRGRVLDVHKTSVLFSVGQSVPRTAWVPRSLIHGGDDRTLDGRFKGEEMSLRIFEWKVDELGWHDAHVAGAAVADLFGGGG